MKKHFLDYSFVALGSLILSLGINLFLVPLKLSPGGISGVGTVLFYFFNIPLSLTNLIINIALFFVGFKVLGRASIIKALFGALSLSLFLELSRFIDAPTLDMVGATILGGALVGLGVGLIIRVGGSSGGSDLLGLILKKHLPHVSIATIILIIDASIIVISGALFGELSITIYSLICMFISARVSEAVIDVGLRAKSIYIMSKSHEEIKKIILTDFKRGVTEIYTQGGFLGEKRPMLFTVVSLKEAPRLAKEISKIDPSAFLVISDVREVIGEGFFKA
ncbi:MAG: YitT family protein [Clostridia bacterium]|nr:YitT family protein [Clostridia bacterium]